MQHTYQSMTLKREQKENAEPKEKEELERRADRIEYSYKPVKESSDMRWL